jgi:hypothetical protein
MLKSGYLSHCPLRGKFFYHLIRGSLDSLKIHINLWLYQGKPPTDGQEVELVIKNAQLPPPGCATYLPIIVKELSDVSR